ncbi:MAG: hypothetical protein OT477_22070 [Chloroflexi bacterium]|nr:hypothetical protein [Chloroflexota bacterium]
MTNLDDTTRNQIAYKLNKMATFFPAYELNDLIAIEKMVVAYSDMPKLVKDEFIAKLDTLEQENLMLICEICRANKFRSLGKLLIEYISENGALSIISNLSSHQLANSIISLINNFELSEFLDIDRQSNRVRIGLSNQSFAVELIDVPIEKRIKTLKLLYDSYVKKILSIHNIEHHNIDKLNRIKDLIRAIGQDALQNQKWAQILLLDPVKYGDNANKNLLAGEANTAIEFDELVFQYYNFLLFPAFGEIVLEGNRISIANEGDGAIHNPRLLLYLDEQELLEITLRGTILAGERMVFQLSSDHFQSLKAIDMHINKTRLELEFKKFGRKFSLSRSIETTRILNWVQENHVKLSAITTTQILFDTVKGFFCKICYLVEQDEGYTLLVKDDDRNTLRSEADIQIVLKHWLTPMCEEYGIDLNREVKTGRGPLDFKFSIGSHLTCFVEIKLWSSSHLAHGVDIQLPTYLIAGNSQYGIYVPIATQSKYEEKLQQIILVAEKTSEKHNLTIEVIAIRAWKEPSASKAQSVSDATRYKT